MSLLLDALKKAADDKNKKLDKSSTDVSPININGAIQDNVSNSLIIDEQAPIIDDDIDVSMELELDAEIADTSLEKNEDFPEVDVPVDITTDENVIKEKLTDNFSHENALDDLDDSPIELNETDANDSIEVKLEDKVTAVTNNSVDTSSDKIDDVTPDVIDTTTAPDLINKVEPKKTYQTASARLENEQALSALINKSNQYSRSEKLKNNITIGILIFFIMIGSGLYFYIEMQTSSQDIYITQNSNAPINRNLNTAAPAQKTTPVPPPQEQVAKPAQSSAPLQLQSRIAVTSKPQVTKQVPKKIISIVRTKRSDPIHVLLRDAYNAFHNQDYRQSEKLYKKVLKQESKNRDALLGLAAIGTKEKRYEYARQKYQYLLKLNPRDSLATAGLSNLENQANPQLNESQLKFMLKQQPDSAHLYFALGTLYSKQNKWPEAQSAYFSAWSAENKTADYAYNLAVSLDHLDKKNQALDFYQLSLKLKQASSGNFSQTDTEDRIHSLKEILK